MFFHFPGVTDLYSQNSADDSILNKLYQTASESSVEQIIAFTKDLPDSANKRKYKILSEALRLCEKNNFIKLKADVLLERGIILYRLNRYEEARDNYLLSLDIYRAANDSNGLRNAFEDLGYCYDRLGNNDSAIHAFTSDLEISEKMGNDSTKSIAYTNLGHFAWRNGDFSNALDYFEQALEIREQYGMKEEIASSLNSIGSVYWKRGNYGKSLGYFIRSMRIREDLNDTLGMVISGNNIGIVFQKLQYFEKAEDYFKKALSTSTNAKYKFGESYSYYNLGQLAKEQDDIRKAISYFSGSFAISAKISRLNLKMMTEIHLGECYECLGEFELAKDYYSSADRQAVKYSDEFVEAEAKSKLAGLLLKQRADINDIILPLSRSNEIATEQNLREIKAENHNLYYKLYSREGLTREALDNYKKYKDIRDDILDENLMNNLTNMVVKFEIEKTESENRLLRKEKELQQAEIEKQKNLRNFGLIIAFLGLLFVIILVIFYRNKIRQSNEIAAKKNEVEKLNSTLSEKNEELKYSNNTKDKLFSVISHDLRNPAGVVHNYCQLLDQEVTNLSKDEIKDISSALTKATDSIMVLIYNLLDWSRSQLGHMKPNFEKIPVTALFESVIRTYSNYAQMKSISLMNNLREEKYIYGDMNMIDTIMRNLITNSIKFTRTGGKVTIDAISDGDFCILSVSDDGIGMSEELSKSLFNSDSNYSTDGTSKEKGTGLGLMLCREFVKLNGGKIGVESQPGKGSRFWFTVPMAKKEAVHLGRK